MSMDTEINTLRPMSGRTLREEGVSYNLADAAEMSMGGKGCVVIADTNKTDSPSGQSFVALQCITDTVIAAYVARPVAPITPTNALVGITIPAGNILYGQLTSITLTSGTVIAYLGVNNASA